MEPGTDPHRALAQALAVFEQAVRRHAAAETELLVARRPSTSKAQLKTASELATARQELTARLELVGWRPPADIDLVEAAPVSG